MKFVHVLGMLAMMIVPASATPLVTNGGFDSNCAGWTFTNTDSFTCANTTGPAGQTGNPSPFAVLNNAPGVVPEMTQTIGGLAVGTSYTLAWQMQSAYRCCSSSSTPGVGAEIDGHLFEFIVPNSQTAWTDHTETFTYNGVSNLLRFTSQRNGTDTDVAIDNVSITANASSVPEPGTYLLITLGLVLGVLRRVRSLE
jgi:hypothetical protein